MQDAAQRADRNLVSQEFVEKLSSRVILSVAKNLHLAALKAKSRFFTRQTSAGSE
jgi:hypothetical protein